MDKTSKLFLREQIRRIRNLNGRIESGDFIMEALDNETLTIINKGIREFLISKALPDSDINEFIDNMITKPFNSGDFCDGSRKIDCKHVAKYILNKMEDSNITDSDSFMKFYENIDNLTKKPNNLRKEVKSFLGLGKGKVTLPEDQVNGMLDQIVNIKEYFMAVMGMSSNAEFNSKLLDYKEQLINGTFCKSCINEAEVVKMFNERLGKSKELFPNADKSQIDEFLKRLSNSKDEIKQTLRLKDSEFDGLVMDIAKKLDEGTFFTEYFMDEIKSFRREPEDFNKKNIWVLLLKHIQKLKQGSLRPIDIKKLMDHFDKNIYPGLAANTSEDFAKSARSDFEEKLSSGTFCEECESRKEIQKKALVAMKTLLKYSDGNIPKGLGKFEFLQGKIDDLLVVNQKEGSDDEEGAKNIPLDKLKNMGGKNIKIKYTPNDILKSDPKMKTFIQMSKGILKGKFNTPPVSGKGDLEIIFYGDDESGVYKFIMPAKKGLSYPKWHEIRIMELDETDNKFKFLYAHKPKFKIKITDVK